MINPFPPLAAAVVLFGAGSALAGPCTQRIAELEKSVIATQEGAGQALAAPATPGAAPAVTPETRQSSAALQMLNRAKQLDQQGKETECMQIVAQIGATTRPTISTGQDQSAPSMQGMVRPGMMGREVMMGRGVMGEMMPGGMPMMRGSGHMMKVIFAIADTNGDGALSFEEVAAIHKRIFDAMDLNKDGKVTPQEFQAFMQD